MIERRQLNAAAPRNMRNLRREEPAAKHILQKGIHTVQEAAAFSADNKAVFLRAVEKALLRQRFNPRGKPERFRMAVLS